MNTNKPSRISLPLFFGVILGLSIPFWVAGALVRPNDLPIQLPISALMAFNPAIAAIILVWRTDGRAGVSRLLRRAVAYDSVRPRFWHIVLILLMPGLIGLAYGAAVLLGSGTPDPSVPITALPIMSVIFFVAAVGEEVGWQGYAFEPLRTKWGMWGAGLGLGVVWAVWHIIPFIQTHNPIWWIVWQCVYTVTFRMIIGWGYTRTGNSIFAAVMLHATSNVAAFMTPNYGSGYNPLLAALFVSGFMVVIRLTTRRTRNAIA